MLPILTVQNIDSHESLFKNDFFDCYSTSSGEHVAVIVYPINSYISDFVKLSMQEFVFENQSFIFDETKFSLVLWHEYVTMDFGLINKFFINLIDELNLVFVD